MCPQAKEAGEDEPFLLLNAELKRELSEGQIYRRALRELLPRLSGGECPAAGWRASCRAQHRSGLGLDKWPRGEPSSGERSRGIRWGGLDRGRPCGAVARGLRSYEIQIPAQSGSAPSAFGHPVGLNYPSGLLGGEEDLLCAVPQSPWRKDRLAPLSMQELSFGKNGDECL